MPILPHPTVRAENTNFEVKLMIFNLSKRLPIFKTQITKSQFKNEEILPDVEFGNILNKDYW